DQKAQIRRVSSVFRQEEREDGTTEKSRHIQHPRSRPPARTRGAVFQAPRIGLAMARAIWKGAITFGLVTIPVELHTAEERREFKLAMIDKRDFSPVGYKRYSKRTGKEVAWDDVVKAYEYEKGEYVVLSDEDFRRADVKASQAIEIQAFVPAKEVPIEY